MLLTGPAGAGKEMVSALAHKISELSLQRTGRLVELNCANLGANMFESQLFGYKWRVLLALIAISEGFACQAKEAPSYSTSSNRYHSRTKRNYYVFESEYRLLGSTGTKKCDAVIILASNQQLDKLVEAGSFRRDLSRPCTRENHASTTL